LLKKELKERSAKYKLLENHLRNYKQYKVAISILQEQLDYLIPGFHASYQIDNNNKAHFQLNTDRELPQSIDRSSSLKALFIYEELIQKKMVLDSIEKSLEQLNQTEEKYVNLRYFQEKSVVATSMELGYSEKYIFQLRKKVLDKLLIPLSGLLVM
jgi:DNA-directed RNA polymerase specialized sigma subunit